MTVLEYDGTFQGFATVLFDALARGVLPHDIAACSSAQPGLSATRSFIDTDMDKVLRIGGLLEETIGRGVMKDLFYAFQSEAPQREMTICRYCAFGMEVGARLDSFLADERVIRMHSLVSRVKKEAHRYLGLTRFQELEDRTLYARIEPDHYILPLIAPHFKQRLPRQTWLIHDLRRGKAAVFTGGALLIAEITVEGEPILSPAEFKIQGTWKGYVKHLTIEGRRNPKLQRQHIPLRYWKHLTEMQSARR